MIQTGGPTYTPERLNTPASLRKFVSDSKKIRYQDEDTAEKAFEKDFLSESGEFAFTTGNALIVGSQFYTPVEKTPVEEESITITRVQTPHKDSQRISVDGSGNVNIKGKTSLYITIDDANHATYYYNKKGGSEEGATITSFQVSKKVADEIRSMAVPQVQGRSHPNSPQRVDESKSPDAYGLPANYIEKLKGGIIQGTGKVEQPH